MTLNISSVLPRKSSATLATADVALLISKLDMASVLYSLLSGLRAMKDARVTLPSSMSLSLWLE